MSNEVLNKLPASFFQRGDVVQIARELLGKILVTDIDGLLCKGVIVEVEAYSGKNDKACHANNGKRTARTEVMYDHGGVAYVYLCYGIHHLFNVVTNVKDKADAVLIRALQPIEGLVHMKMRLQSKNQKLTNGPGILTKAMGITKLYTASSLTGEVIWIEDAPVIALDQILIAKRIGIDYAEEDAEKPWRFYIKSNDWISKK